MAVGGEIKSVLTLDASRFSASLEQASGNLDKLDKRFKSLNSATNAFEKNVTGLNTDVADTADKFRMLEQTLSGLTSKLADVANAGFAGLSSRSRRAKQDLGELKNSVTESVDSLAEMTKWIKNYGGSLESLNPQIANVTKSQKTLSESNDALAKSAVESMDKTTRAKVTALERERQANFEMIASRKAMIEELEVIDRRMQVGQALANQEASKFFGKNQALGASARQESAIYGAQSTEAQATIGHLKAIVKEIEFKNAEVAKSIQLIHAETAAMVAQNAESDKLAASTRAAAEVTERATLAQKNQTSALSGLEKIIQSARVDTEALTTATLANGSALLEESTAAIKAAGALKLKSEADQAAQRSAVERNLGKNALLQTISKAEAENQEMAMRSLVVGEQTVTNAISGILKEGKARKDARDAEKRESNEAIAAATKEAEAVARARREADQEVARSARLAAAERKRAFQEAAEFERQQAAQMQQMWKGMGQLWAASKIQQGFGGSLKAADDYERVIERLDAAGVDGAEGKARTLAVSAQVEKANPNMSRTEALQLTMSGVAGTVSTDTKILGSVMPEIAKILTVMQRQFPEQAHNLEDFGRNVMGVMEARGVTENPTKMLETLDNLARALILTQGKMSVQDYETISRRGGVGNAQLKNNESILYDIAAASQLKVMGGGSGGGGGGVANFANMQKQAQKRAEGGTRETVSATKNLIEFGIIDGEELAERNGGKKPTRNYAPVKYKKGEEASENMTKFAIEMVEDVKKKLAALPESDTRFFKKGVNRQDDAEQAKAFGIFANQSFGNTNVAEFYKMFATHGSSDRIKKEVDASVKAPTYGESHTKAMQSWGIATDNAKKALVDLGNIVGSKLIPALLPLLNGVTSIIRGFENLFRGEDYAAKAGIIAVAVTGITMAVRGAVGVFGIFGGVMSSVRGIMTSGAVATTAATAGWGGLRAAVVATSLTFPVLSGFAATAIAAAARLGGALLGPFAAVKLGSSAALGGLGRLALSIVGFIARFASPVGWAILAAQLGWVVAKWIGSVKVGGLEITGHLSNMMLDIEMGWKNMLLNVEGYWIKFKKLIGGSDYMNEASDKAKLDADRAALKQYDKENRKLAAPIAIGVSPLTNERAINATLKKAKDARRVTTVEDEEKEAAEAAKRNKPFDPFAKPGKEKGQREEREFENSFGRQFSGAEARANIEQLKLDSLVSGEASFAEQAKQEVIKMWAGGDLDDGKDPTKRKFLKGAQYDKDGKATINGKGYDPLQGWGADQIDFEAMASIGGGESKSLNQLIEVIRLRKEDAALLKAVSFSKERAAAMDEESSEALKALAGDTVNQTDAMKALNAEYARLEARTPGTSGDKDYILGKARSLTSKAAIEVAEQGAGARQKTKDINFGLLPTERERKVAGVDEAIQAEEKKLQASMQALDKQLEYLKKNGGEQTEAYKSAIEIKKLAEKDFTDFMVAQQAKRTQELMTPMQKMAQEWGDTYTLMKQAETGWANGFVSTIETALDTGELNFRSFAASVVKDIRKIYIQKSIAEPLAAGIDNFGAAASKALFNTGKDGKSLGGEASSKFLENLGGIATKAADGIKGFWNSITGATGATSNLTESTGESIVQKALEFVGISTKMTAEQTATASLLGLSAAATAAAASMSGSAGGGLLQTLFSVGTSMLMPGALGASVGNMPAVDYSLGGGMTSGVGLKLPTTTPFANGGIMTNFGPVALKKYANGGIANSPQLALYGEAGPEAYVPLPDGRTIPVTMKGGAPQSGGGNVESNVNITINVKKDGESETQTSGDNASDWRKMAERVKGVVREEITAQSRAGGMLYK